MNNLNSRDFVIITDMDGTLIDSDTRLNILVTKVLKEFGYEKSMHIAFKGMAEDREHKVVMNDMKMDKKTREKMEKRLKEMINLEKFSLDPNTRSTLRLLRKKGFKFALVTHNFYEPILKCLNDNGISNIFSSDLIITNDNFIERKPSKKIIDEILKRSGRKSVIIIGNSDSDIRFAMSGNFPIILFDVGRTKLANSYEKIYQCETWREVPAIVYEIAKKR